jgi:hypothetical protein
MARRNEAGQHLLQGLTPQQISDRMGISLGSIRQYLCTLVGEGEILRADIAFNIAERNLIEDVIQEEPIPAARGPYMPRHQAYNLYNKLQRKVPRELIELYLVTRDPRPDLYALICEIEVLLHRLVMQTLKAAYRDRWWREGVPEPSRKNCQIRKEEDKTPFDDRYRYTTFIDLKSIIENDWRVFSTALPLALAKNKPDTLQTLQRVNSIRNQVMHPVKQIMEYENDYRFARKSLADFSEPLWRIGDVQPVQGP